MTPYIDVPPSRRDDLLASAGARWDAILAARPDLTPAIDLQRRLITLVVDLAHAIDHGRLPRLSLPPKYVAAKLERGVPAFAGEPIPLPVPVLTPPLLRLCSELASGGAGEAAEHIRSAIESGSIEAGSLLAASLSRHQEAIRDGAVHRGLAPDLVWLVAELAVSPFAHALQRLLFANAASDEALAAARALEPRLLPRVRIVAGARRGRRRPPRAALLVLRGGVGAEYVRVRLLRRER